MMLRTPPGKRSRFAAFGSPLDLPPPQDDGGSSGGEEEELDDRRAEHDEIASYDSMRCSYKCRNMVKSELLETLDFRDKQVAELEALVKELQSRLNNTEMENERLSGRVKCLDQSVAAALAQEQALRLQRSKEIEEAEERYRKQLIRCNQIQAKLLDEMRLKAEAEASATALQAEVESLKNELDSQTERSSREIRRLQVEIQRLQSDTDMSLFNVSRNERSLSELFSPGAPSTPTTTTTVGRRYSPLDERAAEAAESNHLYPLIDDLQEKLNELSQEKLRLEKKLAIAESKVSTTPVRKDHETEIVIKNLREELNYHTAEIAEAKKLKDVHSKLELLEEQLRLERSRADRAEAQAMEQVDVGLRLPALEAEIKDWKTLCNIPGVSSPNDISQQLACMQREISAAMSENMDLKSKLAALQSSIEKLDNDRQESVAAALAAREEAALALKKTTPLELQVSRMAREIECLRLVIKSYDEEEAAISRHQTPSETSFGTPEKSKQRRIEELENSLQNLQQELKAREKELNESIEVAIEQRKNLEALTESLARAEAKVAAVERDASQLRSEIAILEQKVARGEFDPSKTKVLRLRTNLEMQGAPKAATNTTEIVETPEQCKLILENRQRIKALSESVTSLELEIRTLKKRESRYMQVFAEKASTFRKACGLIFGYEILMNERPDSNVTLFKLNSIYSRDKSYEVIEFQYTPDGQSVGHLDMLANDYTTSPEIERQVTTFLQGFRSIPAFMANLTLELFNKVTIG